MTAGIHVLYSIDIVNIVTLPTNLGDALLKILTDKFALTIFRAHAHSCDND